MDSSFRCAWEAILIQANIVFLCLHFNFWHWSCERVLFRSRKNVCYFEDAGAEICINHRSWPICMFYQFFAIPPLHNPVTWYGINYAETQIRQWDFRNKGPRTRLAWLSFALFLFLFLILTYLPLFAPKAPTVGLSRSLCFWSPTLVCPNISLPFIQLLLFVQGRSVIPCHALRHLLPSIIYSVPRDRIMQRANQCPCNCYRRSWAVVSFCCNSLEPPGKCKNQASNCLCFVHLVLCYLFSCLCIYF